MLKDQSQPLEFRTSEHWESPLLNFQIWVPQGRLGGTEWFKSNSLSGNERNRFVMGSEGGFRERTLVSGGGLQGGCPLLCPPGL